MDGTPVARRWCWQAAMAPWDGACMLPPPAEDSRIRRRRQSRARASLLPGARASRLPAWQQLQQEGGSAGGVVGGHAHDVGTRAGEQFGGVPVPAGARLLPELAS